MTAKEIVDIIWAATGSICVIITIGTLMGCLYKLVKEEVRG